jgi:hypothetical protein
MQAKNNANSRTTANRTMRIREALVLSNREWIVLVEDRSFARFLNSGNLNPNGYEKTHLVFKFFYAHPCGLNQECSNEKASCRSDNLGNKRAQESNNSFVISQDLHLSRVMNRSAQKAAISLIALIEKLWETHKFTTFENIARQKNSILTR